MLSEEKLSEIRERCSKATPGPWGGFEDGGWIFGGPSIDREGKPQLRCTWVDAPFVDKDGDPLEVARIRTDPSQGNACHEAHANAAFIAAAREDVPILLEEISRLREALEEIASHNFGTGCGGGYSDEMGNKFDPCTMPEIARKALGKDGEEHG